MNLANLGKANYTTREVQLLAMENSMRMPQSMNNKVFLYELSQPSDANETQAKVYCRDLSTFLGLSMPLSPLVHKQSDTYHCVIDICKEQYKTYEQN